MEEYKLTQYSHGAGCGCKISPSVLSTILHGQVEQLEDKSLLVGYDSRDDAAVYDLGDGTAIISTTDFFMPIVDDPFTFGRIAATNAISDIYAMGGKPLFAIAVLGWPINTLPPEVAKRVIDGGRQACKDAGIVLAGGHSIDSPEPIFGLAVTGRVLIKHLKKNDTAKSGCNLYLTKPLGIGILTTAQKKSLLKKEHIDIAPDLMTKLNFIGEKLSQIPGVLSMTDVTGFGLLGHLTEMCEGSHLSAVIKIKDIPIIPESIEYLELGCIPGGSVRNWESYGSNIHLTTPELKNILCDPQTSGGLLVAVTPDYSNQVEEILMGQSLYCKPIGSMIEKSNYTIIVE